MKQKLSQIGKSKIWFAESDENFELNMRSLTSLSLSIKQIRFGQKREAREARQRSSQILYIPNMRSLYNGSYTGCLCRYDVIKNNMSYLNQKLATQVTVLLKL